MKDDQSVPKDKTSKGAPQATQSASNATKPMKKAPAPKANTEKVTKPRHRNILRALYLGVLLPCFLAAIYMFAVAKDQYASTMGFSVRSQDVSSAIDILGGISQISGSTGTDTDILFEFMQSQRLVRAVDHKLNLRELYHMPSDPIFGLRQDSSIEDLTKYWSRIVKVFYSNASGLIEVRVTAFRAEDAQRIAQAIYDESVRMINDLSIAARNDATQYAREELALAKQRLKNAREAVQQFRLRTQIVDPEADILGRMGVLNSLQEQLATSQVELDLLYQSTGTSDPRAKQMERRVEVIEERLASERERFSSSESDGTNAYATLVGEYERLAVDRQFAETAYVAALGALDSAIAEASRKSRYLAAYIEPTLAETPEYPRRLTMLATLAGFLFAAWAIGVLIYYSLRDRR